MTASEFISRIAGPALAMAAGALALVQVVSWTLWGFDTPPQGAVDVLVAGAAPGAAAIAALALSVTLIRSAHPASAGRRVVAWTVAGPIVLAGLSALAAQLGIFY